MDIDNDGEIGGSDLGLAQKAFEQGATDEDKEKGTEYLFYNDNLSNGLWDNEEEGVSDSEIDDDAQEIRINPGITEGEVWLEHPAIDRLFFYESRECKDADRLNVDGWLTRDRKFVVSEENPFPETLFVRADGISSPPGESQVEGDLVLMIKVGEEEIAGPKIKLTIVKELGAEKYFHAARDYIFENNVKFFAHDRNYPSPGSKQVFRLCVMAEEQTTMEPLEVYHTDPQDAFDKDHLGIDLVSSGFPGYSVLINGNQTFFSDGSGNVDGIILGLIGQPIMSDMCHGRLIINGVESPATSTDASRSVLAGPDGNYIAQNSSGEFTLAKGQVPTPNPRNAMGGLSTFYASPERSGDPHQAVGYAELDEIDKNLVFTATQIVGEGNATSLRDDCETSGVKSIGSGAGRIKLLILDSGTSVAVAHENPNGDMSVRFKESKHDGFPYYINTYLGFTAEKPR